MQILNLKKSGVPRVPCVPKLLNGFNFLVFNGGTQIALDWNTWAMTHKRCSRIAKNDGKPPLYSLKAFPALPGVNARIFMITEAGQGVNVE